MPNRLDFIRALVRAEETLRWAGSLLILPGRIRLQLLVRANDLAKLLERVPPHKR